ncbi:hypothetical protein RYX36_023392 [Vicia faba]
MLFRNQKSIELIDEDTDDSYYAEVHSTKYNKKVFKNEKFISKGWYEYTKRNKIRRGDVFNFIVRYPPKRFHQKCVPHLLLPPSSLTRMFFKAIVAVFFG